MALARELDGGGECVCADSMQIYRRMDIGTAKPTQQQRATVRHHLLDLVEPTNDGFSVERWLQLAEHAIAEIRSRSRWPIVVGGTNLYVKALLYGLFDGPAPDEELRAELGSVTTEELRRLLVEADPVAAERIHANDRKRSIRAIEVFRTTGRRLSALQTQWDSDARPRSDALLIGLEYPVDIINRRINDRVRAMIAEGLIDEVRQLTAIDSMGKQASEALGYRQILDHLAGCRTIEEAIEEIKIRTRRLAKQQRTWLRRFRSVPRSRWIDAGQETMQTIAQQGIAACRSLAPS